VPEFGMWKTSTPGAELWTAVSGHTSALNREGGAVINICDDLASRVTDGLPFTPGGNPDQPPPSTELINEHHSPGSFGVLLGDSHLAL